MTKKRFLFLLTNEDEMKISIKFSNVIRNKLNDVDVVALYVKDIMKYEVFLNNVTGYGIQSPSIVVDEYKIIENEIYKNIKNKAIEHFDKVYSREGDTHEVILEEMKAFDALVVVKSFEMTVAMKNLLKDHYKPLLILPNEEKEYKLDKILMLNDGGYKVNKSIFAFFHLFGEQNIDVLRVNVSETNRLTERFGNVCNVIDKESDDIYETIMENIKNYDMIVIGELRYTVLFERLTGQTGIKIIENADIPIFMG